MRDENRAVRHARQLRLRGFGPEGQEKIEAARALVVGCGGLGSAVIPALAAAGVGHLHLVDDDTVELSNLNRQILHGEADIGRPKVDSAADFVRALDAAAALTADRRRVDVDNARELVASADVVVDCTDGLPAKFLLNDACVLEGRPLIHAACSGHEGQLMVVAPGGRPCLRCLFETVPPARLVPSCQTQGVLGAHVAWVGSLAALAALHALVGRVTGGALRSFDGFRMDMRTVRFPARADCAVCGDDPDIDGRTPEDYAP